MRVASPVALRALYAAARIVVVSLKAQLLLPLAGLFAPCCDADIRCRRKARNLTGGLLSEFGLVIPQGISHIARRVPESIEDAENDLTGSFRSLIGRLMDHLEELDLQVRGLEAQIRLF